MSKRRSRVEAVQEDMGPPQFYRALADPNRLALLAQLALRGTCTVSDASACCPVDFSVVSRHLALLRDAGLVQAEKRGKEVFYSLRADVVVKTLRRIADAIESCCRETCSPEKRSEP